MKSFLYIYTSFVSTIGQPVNQSSKSTFCTFADDATQFEAAIEYFNRNNINKLSRFHLSSELPKELEMRCGT